MSKLTGSRLQDMMNWLADEAKIDINTIPGSNWYHVSISWPGMPAGESFKTSAESEAKAEHVAKLVVQGVMWATRLAYEATGEVAT